MTAVESRLSSEVQSQVLQQTLKRLELAFTLMWDKLYERIANTRSDYHWKLAHQLCDTAGIVLVEELNLKALAKGMLRIHRACSYFILDTSDFFS